MLISEQFGSDFPASQLRLCRKYCSSFSYLSELVLHKLQDSNLGTVIQGHQWEMAHY